MTRARMQLRGMRIEIDDAGMIVERDGVTYTIVWVAPPVPADPIDELVAPIDDPPQNE
jgi:hypothetical protein